MHSEYQIHILLRFSPASELLLKRVGGIYEAQLQLSLTDDADSIWLYKVCSWSVYITYFILKLEFKFQVKLTMSSLKSIEVKNSSGIIRPKQKSFVHFMCKASKNRLNVMSCYFIRCSKNFFFLSHGSQLERVAPQVFDSSPARPSAAESQEFGNRAK